MKLLNGSDPVGELVELHHCECEHAKHFQGGEAHSYGEPCLHAALKDVRTSYGYFRVCLACVRSGCVVVV